MFFTWKERQWSQTIAAFLGSEIIDIKSIRTFEFWDDKLRAGLNRNSTL